MSVNPGAYANKKRKKPVLKQKKTIDGNGVVKSNPSKRHRDRLNGELERLTDLLPFSEEIRSRLDKLSVLRLSVGYLRAKSYFSASMKKRNKNLTLPTVNGQKSNGIDVTGLSEGDLLLQALNGFVMVVTSEGLVFYVSPTIKDYLGFQESDVVHQSVFELIHTDDRVLFRQQLHFALNPPAHDATALQTCHNAVVYSPEQLPPENSSFLERSFVCRFRCLLDNSSGFLALKFQGRLKYLHCQRSLRDNGTCSKPQLALFAIAMPVQPPTIVEIRSKTLLFQSKHKLDFSPITIDARGRVILGYSETELSMKGSGYQFIHAGDMMYCADNHIRMIRTGESGLSVFRLLSKSGSWVWVKANARLIYKGGGPEFIIAYQKALVNAEGEEHLRQRRLQLPFSCTTGEAVLYDTGPTVDVSQSQFNRMFGSGDLQEGVTPGSLLDSFLKQDEAAYTQGAVEEPPLPVDQVFKDSRALVSVTGDSWQENGVTAATSAPTVVKEEVKQSVINVIDKLEKMVHSGDLSAAFQGFGVADSELMEWELALSRIGQDERRNDHVSAELDSIVSSDVFDIIDDILFKEGGGNGVSAALPDCLAPVERHQQDAFAQAARLDAALPGIPYLPQNLPQNSVFAHQQGAMNSVITGQNCIQKLSHHPPLIPPLTPPLIPPLTPPLLPQADANPPPLMHLHLQDIFSSSIDDASALFQSCVPPHRGAPPHMSAPTHPDQFLVCPQDNFQTPAAAGNGQANALAHGGFDVLPPLIPCSDFTSSGTPDAPPPFAPRLQSAPPVETHNLQVERWTYNEQQRPPYANFTPSGAEPTPTRHQRFPLTGLNHPQQGGLACSQAAAQSSCMFDRCFANGPAGGDAPSQGGLDVTLDQSPPQGCCYFQWSHGEPVEGTSAIAQESTSVSPPNTQLNTQHALQCNGHTHLYTSHCGTSQFTPGNYL
ncbi:aryl hydrocarbon receptor-like [Antennarius striatus]|uniref:aryl hydrocarbon receptor-like n=1 Tax=Antennarius striatus TaxID=241820 RepID=UPI0035B284A8